MRDYFVGVDLGGTNVQVCLLDLEGEIIGRASTPTQAQQGPVSLIDRVSKVCNEVFAAANVAACDVKAFCIGSPGRISISQGKIISADDLPGFENFRLRAELSSRLNIPGLLESDANVACWGEFWRGAGRGTKDMVMFTLDSGIGSVVVVDGELLHGSRDNGVALGHMIIDPKGRKCICGQLGCLEAYASANPIAKRVMEALEDGTTSALKAIFDAAGTITSKDVFDCAVAGDPLANDVVDEAAKALAQACVSMRHITEPQTVVFSGDMIKADGVLAERVDEFYKEIMWTLKPEPMKICLAQLGADAAVLGAAGMALHYYQTDRLEAVGQ